MMVMIKIPAQSLVNSNGCTFNFPSFAYKHEPAVIHMWLKISLPITVPTPNADFSTNNPRRLINNSGASLPAAITIAPATLSGI